jgi:hypothetical protein
VGGGGLQLGAVGGAAGALGGKGQGGGIVGGGGAVIGRPPDAGEFKWFIPKQAFVLGERKMVDIVAPAFTAKGLAHLKSFIGLTELHVGNEKLADADMAELGKLTGLKRLGVFAPGVTDKGIAAFKDLEKLEMLDLRGTKLTTASAPTLRRMKSLKLLKTNLTIMDPKLKAKEAEWRKLLPRVKVEAMFGGFGFAAGGGKPLGGRR